LHESLKETLIRKGLDQCKLALNKLSKNRLYQHHKDVVKDRKLELRSFEVDEVDGEIQLLIRRLIQLGDSIDLDSEDETISGGSHDDDGWADPESQSPIRSAAASENPFELDILSTKNQDEAIDPHPYANRKRKSSRTTHLSRQRRRGSAYDNASRAYRKRDEIDASVPSTKKRARSGRRHHTMKPCHKRTKGDNSGELSHVRGDGLEEETVSDSNEYLLNDAALPTKERARGTRGTRRNVAKSGSASGTLMKHKQPEFGRLADDDGDGYLPFDGDASRLEHGFDETKPDAVTRMERFLGANKDLDVASSDASQEGDLRSRSWKNERKEKQRPSSSSARVESGHTRHNSLPESRERRFELVERSGLHEALFSTLNTRASSSLNIFFNDDEEELLQMSLHGLCTRLVTSFPEASCIQVIHNIVSRLKGRNSGSVVAGEASVAFGTFLKVLRNHGSETLMSLVSRESPSFRAHIHLLVAILELMNAGLNQQLHVEDGTSHLLFAPDMSDVFINFLLLQMVDVVYAVLHPSAWALQLTNPGRILDILEPLRCSISQHLHLSEGVCRCVMNELGYQRWYLTADNRHAYVSSVDPEVWSLYLSSGDPPSKPTSGNVRVTAFKDGLPRCEIDAMWSILAYFSSSAVASTDRQVHYWNLIKTIFARGVQAQDPDSTSLAPSQQQLDATNLEIRYLATMLIVGTTGSLPRNDAVLANIIRSALLLDGDDCLHNENYRLASFPSLRQEKRDKKMLRSFWKKVTAASFPTEIAVIKFGIHEYARNIMDAQKESMLSVANPMLVPFSPLLVSCAGLLTGWIGRVPLKDARQARLTKGIDALVNQLLNDSSTSSKREGSRSSSESDPFAEAFAVPVDRGRCAGAGTERRELALRDAAAFLTVVSQTARGAQAGASSQTGVNLIETVWSFLADDTMKKRRNELARLEGSLTRDSSFVSDSLRLFLVARNLSFAAMIFMGAPAWQDSSTYPSIFAKLLVNEVSGDDSYLVSIFSCLSASLDCACDAKPSLEIATSIACLMGILLSRARQLMSCGLNDSMGLVACIQKLRKSILKLVLSPICRCCRVITSAASCGAVEDLCFASLLSLLRGVMLLAEPASEVQATMGTATVSTTADDDGMWGGLSDDVFASLDVGTARNEQLRGDTRATLSDVWDMLHDSIKQAEPSTRFLIVRPGQHGPGAETMTSQGKRLIADNICAVCRCLTAIAAFESGSRTDMLLSQFVSPLSSSNENEDRSDIDFRRSVAQCISSEMLASTSLRIKETLQHNPEPVLWNLFEQLLDHILLEKLPSSNLNRIRARRGEDGEKKELHALMSIVKGEAKVSVKDAVEGLWGSCASFGQIVSDWRACLGSLLKDLDPDLPEYKNRLTPLSLEKECLDRFRLFRGIVSSSSVDGLRLATLVFTTTSNNLAQILEILRVQQLSPASRMDQKQARLLELFSCYSNLHFALISWIFCKLSESNFDAARSLWARISEHYFSPIVRGEMLNIPATARYVLSGAGAVARHSQHDPFITGVLSDNVFRRSCELMVCIAREYVRNGEVHPGALFTALVEAGIKRGGWISWSICQALCGSVDDSLSCQDKEDTESSPLQFEIDSYLWQYRDAFPLGRSDALALWKLKLYALKRVLVPKLCRIRTDATERHGILRQIQYMLTMESWEDTFAGTRPRVGVQCLFSMLQGIRASVRMALTGETVNNNLVDLAYQCAITLVNLPTACIDDNGVGWLIDWTCPSSGDGAQDEPSLEPAYCWSFFSWLRVLGEIILEDDPSLVRAELRSLSETGAGGSTVQGASRFQASWDNMMSLEGRVLHKNDQQEKGVANMVTNIYASRFCTGGGGSDKAEAPIAEWSPTPAIRRSIHSFVAKVRDAEISVPRYA